MRALLALSLLLLPVPAQAQGFKVRDLSTLAPEMEKALGAGFVSRAEPGRVTLTCPECAGAPMVDVLLGRQDDGTEARVRSGKTPVAALEALCRQRNPACHLTGLRVAPAVGWVSTYPMGGMAGSTAIILRDGDLLTIRSIAGDAPNARANTDKLVQAVVGRIAGD